MHLAASVPMFFLLPPFWNRINVSAPITSQSFHSFSVGSHCRLWKGFYSHAHSLFHSISCLFCIRAFQATTAVSIISQLWKPEPFPRPPGCVRLYLFYFVHSKHSWKHFPSLLLSRPLRSFWVTTESAFVRATDSLSIPTSYWCF